MRPSLTIISGAGFAKGLGGLSVQDIDSALDALPAEIPNGMSSWNLTHSMALERLIVTLKRRFGAAYNFELLISALEDALPFGDQPFVGEPTATIRSVAMLANWDPHVLRDVMEWCISTLLGPVEESLLNEKADELRESRAFLRDVTQRFRVEHIDLNYDDYSDRSYDASNDGFVGRGYPKNFDVRKFRDATDDVVLMHLHGSYRYRYDSNVGFVKLAEAGSRALPLFVPRRDGGVYTALISGTTKIEKLAIPPFLNYYQRFSNAVLATPRLLLLGYGGSDLHLNTYLAMMRQLHGEALRVVWVVKGDDLRRESIGLQWLCAIFGGLQYQGDAEAFFNSLELDSNKVSVHGEIMVAADGYPVKQVVASRAIEHLLG